jgi:dCTP deaminase
MILSDRGIERAIRNGHIRIDPLPDPSQFDSSSLNLRVGDDFRVWSSRLRTEYTDHGVQLDSIDLADLREFTEPLEPVRGIITIEPDAFVLVRTLEHITFPVEGQLAARVEGRSKQARLGMTAHITAPTIHAGFGGKIVLEIKNFGPWSLRIKPNDSRLCQLIFEKVSSKPRRSASKQFADQESTLGNPRKSR